MSASTSRSSAYSSQRASVSLCSPLTSLTEQNPWGQTCLFQVSAEDRETARGVQILNVKNVGLISVEQKNELSALLQTSFQNSAPKYQVS